MWYHLFYCQPSVVCLSLRLASLKDTVIIMADNRPIGIFDSGLGGLTVAREIIKQMPNENIVYFGDTGRVPYGTKSRETIRKYAMQDESFLLSKGVKIIVAACGTVSSVAADTGAQLPVPFIDVVTNGARRAVEATRSGRIGVIGTTATVMSNSYKKYILSALPNAEVFQNDCSLFVPLVEEGWIDRNDPVTVETVRRYLMPIKEKGIDVLIMGCTHYPVLTDIIRDFMGEGVTLVNTGEYTALAVKDYLTAHGMAAKKEKIGNRMYYVSDRTESFSKTASILMGCDINGSVERVYIDSIKEIV